MILKADDELRELALAVPSYLSSDNPEPKMEYVTVGTAQGPVMVPIEGKPIYKEDISHLKPLIPDWMLEALISGSVLLMDKEDYYALDSELRDHLEVMRF